jgi:hypothetical protein
MARSAAAFIRELLHGSGWTCRLEEGRPLAATFSGVEDFSSVCFETRTVERQVCRIKLF